MSVAACVLVALCVAILHRQLPPALDALKHASPIAFAVAILFVVWNHFAALAWAALLKAVGMQRQSVGQLARLRIEAQAVNQLVPAAGFAGEAVRTVSAAGPAELEAASVATILDNLAGTLSGFAFAAFAISLHVKRTTEHTELGALVLAAAPAAVALLVACVLPFRLASWTARTGRSARLRPEVLRRMLGAFTRNQREIRRAFGAAIGLRLVERVVAAVEIYVLFVAVGAHVSAGDAALISAVLVLVSFAVFFVPGQLGAAEMAVASASSLIGVPPALGLSAALLRRVRQLGVCVLGVASLAARRFRRGPTGETAPAGRPS